MTLFGLCFWISIVFASLFLFHPKKTEALINRQINFQGKVVLSANSEGKSDDSCDSFRRERFSALAGLKTVVSEAIL